MLKEKIQSYTLYSEVKIEESKIVSFNKYDKRSNSFRVYKDGFAGIYFQYGNVSDEEGFKKAEENLELKRPYEFDLETGKRSRDLTEEILTDAELISITKKALSYLKRKYPDFIYSGHAGTITSEYSMTNSKDLDYFAKDGYNTISIEYKHKDSKELMDGYFTTSLRKFKIRTFYKMADNYLENYQKQVPLPKECIIMKTYYDFTNMLRTSLDAEKLKLGTSLLSGKVGQKIFSDDLTVLHNVTDKDSWMDPFWDGEGVVNKGDRVFFIKNGKILRGYADKKTAKKYRVRATGSAHFDFADIPSNGRLCFTLKIGKKSARELLGGKLAIIPVLYSGGGFKEEGEYKMPVHVAFLTDGEKILGRVPPFTMSSSMFDMFGKDFIGVAKHNKILNDKCMLVKMKAEELSSAVQN